MIDDGSGEWLVMAGDSRAMSRTMSGASKLKTDWKVEMMVESDWE